jgi:hypothetical protein
MKVASSRATFERWERHAAFSSGWTMFLNKLLRSPVLWWLVAALLIAAGTHVWMSIPPSPRFVIQADENSFLLGFSADGTTLATQRPETEDFFPRLDWKGPIHLWSVATGEDLGALPQSGVQGDGECWSARNGNVRIGTVENGAKRGGSASIEPMSAGVLWDWCPNPMTRDLGMSYNVATKPPDHNVIAAERTFGRDWIGDVVLWDVGQGRLLAVLQSFDRHAEARFSPDGKALAVNSFNGVNLYDPTTGQRRAELFRAFGPVFIPGAHLLAAFTTDPTERQLNRVRLGSRSGVAA